jgi:hypothetical protein
MTSFDAFLKANQPRTREEQLSNPMAEENISELCGACGLFDDPIIHDCELSHEN